MLLGSFHLDKTSLDGSLTVKGQRLPCFTLVGCVLLQAAVLGSRQGGSLTSLPLGASLSGGSPLPNLLDGFPVHQFPFHLVGSVYSM